MTGDIQNLVATISGCRAVVAEQKKNMVEFNTKIEEVEREISERVDHLKLLLDQEKMKILEELASFKSDRIKEIDNVVEEVQQHVSFAESMVKYIEELQKKGTASDIAQQNIGLHKRAEDLLKLDSIQQAINNLGTVEVVFTAENWPTHSNRNVIGKLQRRRTERK
jgi:uncharacterized coiled-coil protein SlyX